VIRIIDRTLSCPETAGAPAKLLREFFSFLLEMDVDAAEMSRRAWDAVSPSDRSMPVILRLEAEHAGRPPANGVSGYVMNGSEPFAHPALTPETVIGDMREIYILGRFRGAARLRVGGLHDVLLGDYPSVFRNIRAVYGGIVELCPSDRLGLATPTLVEWITADERNRTVVTAFAGAGGYAPTEQVVMALRCLRLRKAGKGYPFLPDMAACYEKMTGIPVSPNRPVIGGEIFRVQSGIHIDGIAKQPRLYEPFPPETVGLSRTIVIGKQSGAAAIRLKLEELGLSAGEEGIAAILEAVKETVQARGSPLTDGEFLELVRDRQVTV